MQETVDHRRNCLHPGLCDWFRPIGVNVGSITNDGYVPEPEHRRWRWMSVFSREALPKGVDGLHRNQKVFLDTIIQCIHIPPVLRLRCVFA